MKTAFTHHMIILGFGSIGRALLPLLFQKFHLSPSQILIITEDDSNMEAAEAYGVSFQLETITADNYLLLLDDKIQEHDFVIDASYGISSACLIKLCDRKGALYINTSTEPWDEEFDLEELAPAFRTNYMLRHEVLQLKGTTTKTAVLTHGANPGLCSHFVKQALLEIARDNHLDHNRPQTAAEWAHLAMRLNIKVIHVAERDSQMSLEPKKPNEFVNTWSPYGLVDEGLQPAELGWGTHEKHWPSNAFQHEIGSQGSIYLDCPSASIRVRSWTPSLGSFHGYLIAHPESSSIPDFLTLKDNGKVIYRPTVHYAYHPCPDALLSLNELRGKEWEWPDDCRIISHDITEGMDELGVLLMGNEKGAYWYGSQLSIEEARSLVPYNNATSLQVVAGIFAAMVWAIEHPNEGIVEPEDLDHDYIMNLALPYLGKVAGHYTNWTSLDNRGTLYSEPLDRTDPWQFLNMLVR